MTQFCTVNDAPVLNKIPLVPIPAPSIVSPRRVTLSLAPALIVMAGIAEPLRTPATPTPSLMMLIALVMVTALNPPGSSTSISPPAAVLSCAPWKVRHGCVRVQGLASLPSPDTQVRPLSAEAGAACRPSASRDAVKTDAVILVIVALYGSVIAGCDGAAYPKRCATW